MTKLEVQARVLQNGKPLELDEFSRDEERGMICIKQSRKLDSYILQSLCIKKSWYTKGNNKEYSDMLLLTKKENLTSTDIYEIAIDIFNHSDLSYDYTKIQHIENIMFSICKACDCFFEIEETNSHTDER